MNLVLFEPGELDTPLPREDARARHILDVLRRTPGDTFDAGIVDGPLGKAMLAAINDQSITLTFQSTRSPAPLPDVTLIVGLPRPQTARDILRDSTTLGAGRIHFLATERTDPNYAASTLWASGEWRRHCLAGAAQAFDTRLPQVTWTNKLADALAQLSADSTRIALDNYEATAALVEALPAAAPTQSSLVLALGPERGWGAQDRAALRAAGFTLAHLGSRVLRLETAVVAGLTLAIHARR